MSLSSISSEDLWQRSGRLEGSNSEVGNPFCYGLPRLKFHVTSYFTSEIGKTQDSYFLRRTKKRSLRLLAVSLDPIRTCPSGYIRYVSTKSVHSSTTTPPTNGCQARKYRDEPRPRQGLLRTREFIMKDLYTFDLTRDQALQTYDEVRDAYVSFFDTFKIPYLVAEADSGSMGGDLSHEYHFPASNGEDTIISCSTCHYVANAELAQSGETFSKPEQTDTAPSPVWFWDCGRRPETYVRSYLDPSANTIVAAGMMDVTTWTGVTQDRRTLVIAYYPSTSRLQGSATIVSWSKNNINVYAVKAVVEDLATGIEDPVEVWMQALSPCQEAGAGAGHEHARILRLVDHRVKDAFHETFPGLDFPQPSVNKHSSTLRLDKIRVQDITADPITHKPLNLLQIKNDDPCPKCSTGRLKVQRAVEIGHTFFLGTRYSKALQVSVAADSQLRAEIGHSSVGAELLRAEKGHIEKSAERRDHALLQMGCHGIGVSRLVAAVANTLADSKGLNWPRVIAPYEVVIIPAKGLEDAAAHVYDQLVVSSPSTGLEFMGPDNNAVDVVLDDRDKDMVWKLGDADLIGYPVIVVVGRSWRDNGQCEVQCRRLRLRTLVSLDNISEFVLSLLIQL